MFKQSLYKRIIILIILSALFGLSFTVMYGFVDIKDDVSIPGFDVITPFVDSNRHTHQKSDALAVTNQSIFEAAHEIQTEGGLLYVDRDALAIQVVNSNGYLWSSSIDHEAYDFANTFKERARSAIILESFNTKAINYAITEENLFTAQTTISFNEITNGFSARIVFGRSKIKMTLIVTYDQEGLHVKIPMDLIDESGDFKVASIKVYPYFGAVNEDQIPGYVFIPDGVGALIDHQASNPLIGSNYQKDIYGRSLDYNILNDLTSFNSGDARIYAPVFGTVHGVNQQALFVTINQGAEFGRINYYFPSRNRGFSNVFSDFVFRRTYAQPIDQMNNIIPLLQNFSHPVDIDLTYHFLEGQQANYVGMASLYREKLFGEKEQTVSSDQIPIRLDFIGLEKKEGLLFTNTLVMTTLKDMIEISSSLNNLGIDRIHANILGFSSQGVSWSPPTYKGLSKKLGSQSDLSVLSNHVENINYAIDVMMASTQSSGFNRFFDLAKKINDQQYTYRSMTDTKYLLTHDKVEDQFHKAVQLLSRNAIDGLAFHSFGNVLYKDHNASSNRLDLILMLNELLESLEETHITTYDTNAYLWQVSQSIYDMPMYSSQYVMFTDTVPFLSMVLAGHVQMFAPYANFYAYPRDDLLRMIDFHIYPSFVLTKKSSKYLQKSNLEHIYASQYEGFEHVIDTYYHFLNDALSHVYHQEMIFRQVINQGVVLTTYSNGVSILINYLDQSYTYQNTIVGPKTYLVMHND